jgi:hypothetical protein
LDVEGFCCRLDAGVGLDSMHEQTGALDEVFSGGFLVVVEGEDGSQCRRS